MNVFYVDIASGWPPQWTRLSFYLYPAIALDVQQRFEYLAGLPTRVREEATDAAA